MSRGATGALTFPRLAWSLWALSAALTVSALLLLVLNLNYPVVHVYDYWLENTLSALLFSTVGAVVGSRRPPRCAKRRHPGGRTGHDASRALLTRVAGA